MMNRSCLRKEELRVREKILESVWTDARYAASLLLRRYCLMSLREIGRKVGLHYSAVGNAIRQVRDRPTAAQAKLVRELDAKFKNQ